MLNVVSGDIGVNTPTGDVVNMNTGDTVDMGIKVLINGILTKIDEVLDTSNMLTANTIKGDIKDAFCNIVDNLNHSNSMEEENPFHFCHGNMDGGS